MPLPVINEFPTYTLVVPSTKQKIKYRPFLVQEQKILLMALETKDPDQVLSAITDAIQACVLSPIKIETLTTFDVEYVFLQLRAKSVGERANITILCGECKTPNSLTVVLDEVKIEVPSNQKMTVKINDQYTVKLRYPKYNFLLHGDTLKNDTSMTAAMYEQVLACLDSVMTDDEVIKFDDEPREEIEAFIARLTTQQFQQILDFVVAMPKLQHPANFKCTSCGHDNKYVLQGISDFF